LVLLLAAMLLTVGAVSADLQNWQVKCGLGDNVYPYGNDFSTRFGVDPAGTWAFDGRDAAHPPVADPSKDLAFIYQDKYDTVYAGQTPHDVPPFTFDAPIGWPPPWKPGAGDPDYPFPGALKDTREPILVAGQPELWLVYAYAPNTGETCSFIWEWNTEPDFMVPAAMDVRIWANPELEAAGVVGDLILNKEEPGVYKVEGIPQWGWNDNYGVPIRKQWVIQATLIPEPAVAQLAGLVFGIAGLGIARFRRK
jgi:hypothetical protein